MNKTLIAKLILRYGFVAVFVWFGVTQIADPSVWTALIPEWVVSMTGQSANILVFLNGVGELILAFLLAIGLWIPIVSILLSIHLFSITFSLGMTAIAVRDFGLALSILALAFLYWKKEENLEQNIPGA